MCDSRLAAFLQDCGFDGIIQSADVLRRDGVPARKRDDPPPHVEDCAFRWPQYKRSSKTEIVYPVVLEATSPEQFRLSLPNPATQHTNNLLHLYGRGNPHLRLMISLIYVWLRSWGVKQISPATLFLLLIRFFQEEEVSRLTDAGYPTSVSAEQAQAGAHYTTKISMQFDTEEGPNQPVLLDVSYALCPFSHNDFSLVLLHFLRWIVSKKFHHMHTGEGETWPIVRINHPNIIDQRFAGELRNFDVTSSPWSRHQLIVPDPFVVTHNHAFNVHRSTLHYISVLAESCVTLLRNTRPLHTIFGPYYKPEILAEQRRRSRSPSPVRPLASRSLIGIRMERRLYFSDPHVREELMRLYQTTVPGRMIRDLRQRTVTKVGLSIRNNFGSQYRVDVFGSTQYGVDGQTSDLDLVVIDPDRMTGFTPEVDLSSLPRIYKISEVSGALQRSGFKILQRVPRASVPIVKFKDPTTGIQCDLNINDQLGSINTSLIRHYCDILPVLRPLLLAIKRWARPLGYNNPAGALGMPITFSSYALAIMTIGLLQTRGLLPNLQEGPALTEGRVFWLRTKTEERVHCDARWKMAPNWAPPVTVGVEQALQDWFQYWGHEHDYRNNLISVRWGGVVPREVPCNKKEAESLRDGPFSSFRPSSNAFLEKGAFGKSPLGGKEKSALSEADVKVLEWQEAQAKQASVAAGSREEDEAEDEFNVNDTHSEADRNLEEAKEEFESTLEADDTAQSSRWESDILCVTDPFIRAKNLAGPIRPNVILRFREDCQRVVLRLRMGGNLDALLRFDPRIRPPSPPPQPRPRRRQQPQRGVQDGNRGRNGPARSLSRGGAPKTT
ncbi:hypothetical protein BJV78DRAFT_1246095 [Lactifluus subvellereus]|nr:hypothetical protein BJV78DRAFT_1246095 [Lactifluus subvellereus]